MADSAINNTILPYKFCLITDFRFMTDENMEKILCDAISGGVDCIQYRDKNVSSEKQFKRAKRIREITKKKGVGFFVNSSIDLASQTEADGIQLGKDGISVERARQRINKGMLIGASVHNKEEILSATRQGADFLLLSPLFKPGSKDTTVPVLGEKKFSLLCRQTKLPVLALGGITYKNAHIPASLGAYGIACITGILKTKDIYAAARRQAVTELEKCKNRGSLNPSIDHKSGK